MSDRYLHTKGIGAICLVGGLGERLANLTWPRTKAAVMFGPAILSAFSTSSALNSHVPYVILATQHRPYSLKKFYSDFHHGNYGAGKRIEAIDPLDTSDAPKYKGTADAFYQALGIAERRKPKYILGLSGDHVVKLDFENLFEQYLSFEQSPDYKGADFVVFTQKVKREDVNRFGILIKDGTRIVDFKEKPKLEELPDQEEFDASMGIYFAPTKIWREVLESDQAKRPYSNDSKLEKDPLTQTQHDIGGDIIPSLISKYDVRAFIFEGYWRDVGIPSALYETQMDILIKRKPDLFGDPAWKIESINQPHFHSHKDDERYFTAGRFDVSKSKINDSIFSPGVEGNLANILNSIFFGESQYGTTIGNDSHIERAIVDKDIKIGNKTILKAPPNHLILISRQTTIPNKTRIEANDDAIVAPLEELLYHVDNIIGFRKRVSPGVELYLPNGTQVKIEELMEELLRKSH